MSRLFSHVFVSFVGLGVGFGLSLGVAQFIVGDDAQPAVVHSTDNASEGRRLEADQGVRRELWSMRQQLTDLQAQQRAGKPAPQAAGEATAESELERAHDTPEAHEEAREAITDLAIQTLEDALQDEVRDQQWARTAEAAVAASVREQDMPRPQSVATECRNTFCRVEMAFLANEDIGAAAKQLPHKLPWPANGMIVESFGSDTDGPSLVWYVAREDHDLPPMPAAPDTGIGS